MRFISSKVIVLLLGLIFIKIGLSQKPTTYFDDINPNIKYLEHLIKEKIDQVRLAHDLTSLANDSILYLAANDHAAYLEKHGRLSHYQVQNSSKKTPQLRAEFYGAKNYKVGENVAMTSYGADNKTYQTIASSIVTGWVNSPGHYQNIITSTYKITGLSVAINTAEKTVYACQKFAYVDLKFVFQESSTLFPYSNYSPPKQINSFSEVSNILIPKYKYAHRLRHDKLEKCADCPNKFKESPDISLRYDERRGFILRVENSDYVRKIIRNKKDGFAVEIVDFEDYACGSPFYYEKPSRRNGQLRLNGKVLEPKYRKELFKGYKRRKTRKKIKFFPYIFRKDSVRFFKRFGQYKVDKYTSKYFEIRLGHLPKDAPRLFNYNLIVLKDRQICDVYYFTQYCEEVYEEYKKPEIIPYKYDDFKYRFQIIPDDISFSIPFQQGEYTFEKEEVLKHIDTISSYDFIIDSVKINAYSSVEGDSAVNAQLQLRRGENIASIFQGIQKEQLQEEISTAINWRGLRMALVHDEKEENRKLTHLKNRELLKEINKNPQKYEYQLSATRKGEVQVYFHVLPNLKSLDYYIKHEMKLLDSMIYVKLRNREAYENELILMGDLYRYTYAMIKKGYLDPSFFLEIELPIVINENPKLVQYYLLFGFEYPDVFSKMESWQKDSSMYIRQYKKTTKIDFIPEFNYLTLKLLSEDLIESKSMTENQYDVLKKKALHLEYYYENFKEASKNMDKINFNLNMLALNYFYKSNPAEQQENAVDAISQVHEYYLKNNLLYDTLALNLAEMAVFYQNTELGLNIVNRFEKENDNIRKFINKVSYVHSSAPFSEFYYQKLMNDSKKLPISDWCNLFISPCGIPFQAFDHEKLRTLYCKLCIGKNDYLNEVY